MCACLWWSWPVFPLCVVRVCAVVPFSVMSEFAQWLQILSPNEQGFRGGFPPKDFSSSKFSGISPSAVLSLGTDLLPHWDELPYASVLQLIAQR